VTAPPIVVLVEPQDLVNIAATVRIAKNFGIERIRLVRPRTFDSYRIEGIAHNTGDIVARIQMFDSLDLAIGDCVHVLGMTARERRAKRQLDRPRAAALDLVERSAAGPVALVFGREDQGLTNEELDRCHALATIATNPEHRSLNLAQAVAVMGYECWNAREGTDQPRKPPRRRAGTAKTEDLALLFHDWHRALWALDFFKSRNAENVMRSFRELVFRAELDAREAKLLRAMALEAVNYLTRHQVLGELPDDLKRPGGKAHGDAEGPGGLALE
jgi:tRNA/rRNA methyltransferase/tRNA (cytidine32/uridine32-2'-O)-methyltransferase